MPTDSPHVALSITEGRTVRDLFYNGLLDYLTVAGATVTVFTEAVAVPEFVAEWQGAGVMFAPFIPIQGENRVKTHAHRIRRRLMQRKADGVLRPYMALERRLVRKPHPAYEAAFRQQRPQVYVSTNVYQVDEADLLDTARYLGIPTLGVLRSWDNVYKGLHNHPDHIAVWNRVNLDEVVELDRFKSEAVSVIGAAQFDPYFDDSLIITREQVAAHFGFDTTQPIITFATLGQFTRMRGFDETTWMDDLIELCERGELPGTPQIICRLHPLSRLELFQRYLKYPYVRLSYTERYWPALGWYMNRDDVALVGNILRHSDAVITPASTITLESAIFDTPTLVTVFHRYQPERARDFFSFSFGKHFRRLDDLDLVPILRDRSEFGPALRRCLEDPAWYRQQRAQIVRDYAQFTDGQSTRRLADLILKLAQRLPSNG